MNLEFRREAIINNYFNLNIILFAILFFSIEIFPQLSSPYYQWVKNAGSTSFDQSFCAAVDNQGNIIVSGYCDSTANIGGIIVPNFGQSDIVIAKYDKNGNIIWAKNAGGPYSDEAYGVLVDHENNIIVTGYFNGSATFDTITVQAFGIQDFFIAKYNPDGQILWLGHSGGVEASDAGYGVAVDDQDNLILTGQMFGEIYINDTTLYGGANSNIFLIKGDKDGNIKWAHTTTGDGFYNAGYGVATDKNNNIYLCGTFGDTTTFSTTTLRSAGGSDIFIAKVDPNGNLIWVKQAGGSFYNDIAYDIKIGNDGMLYLTGGFGSTATFGNISITSNGIEDIFIAKYDTSGNPIWVKQEGQANGNLATGIAVDKGNNVSIIGMYNQLVGSSPNQISEVYIGRYNSDGIKSWQSIINSSDYSYSGGMAVSDNGDLFFSGAFSGTGVFGGTSVNSFNGSEDIFTGSIQAPHLHTQKSLIFSSGQVGETYYSTFSIINQSQTKLYIRNYRIAGRDSADFSLNQSTLADSINGNQFANIGVNYSPLSKGEKQAYIIISSDSPTNPDTVFLKGLMSDISLSSDTLNFGTLDLNNSINKNLTITNSNTLSNLNINLNISGSDSSEFSISSLHDSIPPLGNANVNVTFTPQTEGNKFAVLNIFDTSAVKLDSVILIGSGIQAITVQYGDTATLDHNTILNINPPPGFIPLDNKFFYRKSEDLNYYQDFLIQNDTSSFVGVIPSTYSTVTGVEYYIVFYGEADSITYPFSNPVNHPASVILKIPSYLYPSGIGNAQYQMVSIPLNLRDPNILSVLSDYGTYDTRNWRILRWQPELNNYIEYPELTSQFIPGNAFWLIRRDGKKFTIRNALTINSTESYPITVHPGWNQIGDPFAFSVSWDSISNSGLLQPPIHWNAAIQDYEINQSILDPWTGYWVYNPESADVTLMVPPIAQTSLPKSSEFTDLNKDEFYIQIEGSIKNTNIIDRQNFVGMFEQSRIIQNKSDILAPPSITGSLDLNIVENKRNYAQSIVSVSSEGAYWDLKVTSNNENKDVIILFNSEASLPKDFEIWFFDMDRQTAIPVVNNSVEVQLPSEGLKNCRIIVGKEDYAKSHSNNIPLVPLNFALFQNYPNPFNPSTNIIYQLREKSNVTLEIFDILGRRIVSLINNQILSPGRHTIIWNGKNSSGIKVSSGVYLYRIRANNFVDTKKMVLLR